MANPYLIERLRAMRGILLQAYSGGSQLSSATKGHERETFVHHALANVIAPPFRIGSGDITDSAGNRSGQLDTVIEFASSISFPMLRPDAPRLYLAEGVCAVLEIKSDLQNQWSEVTDSHAKLSNLQRSFGSSITFGKLPLQIPHFAVGFRGWKKLETLKQKVQDSGIDGALCIEEEMLVTQSGDVATGDYALFVFFVLMQRTTSTMLGSNPDFFRYLENDKQAPN